MLALTLLSPATRSKPSATRCRCAGCAVRLGRGRRCRTDAEQALFGEPGMPPPKDGWQRSRVGAVRRRGGAGRGGRRAASAAGLLCRLQVAVDRRGARAGLGAADAIAVRAGGDHARVLDRADLARAAGAGAPGDPARPGPGLRHRHASDHAHVPALDRRARHAAGGAWTRVLDYGCGSGILAIGAAKFGAARHRRGRHRRGRGRVDRGQCQANGVRCTPACPTAARARTRWCWPTSWPRR